MDTWKWLRPRCPFCGAEAPARILWGKPAMSEALEERLARKELVLGGCCVSENDELWECVGCRRRFGRRADAANAANEALSRLLEGNARYRAGSHTPAKLTDRIRKQTASTGQQPYAAVVCCADSRSPAEHIFSAGIGELFVIRNAGNVISPSALASVEYAVLHLHVPLVLVLGHRGCGAVAAAFEGHGEPGALGELIAQVRTKIQGAGTLADAELRNLRSALADLQTSAPLQAARAEGSVFFVGALYDIRTGEVTMQFGAEQTQGGQGI